MPCTNKSNLPMLGCCGVAPQGRGVVLRGSGAYDRFTPSRVILPSMNNALNVMAAQLAGIEFPEVGCSIYDWNANGPILVSPGAPGNCFKAASVDGVYYGCKAVGFAWEQGNLRGYNFVVQKWKINFLQSTFVCQVESQNAWEPGVPVVLIYGCGAKGYVAEVVLSPPPGEIVGIPGSSGGWSTRIMWPWFSEAASGPEPACCNLAP